VKLGAAILGNRAADPLKVGESFWRLLKANPEPSRRLAEGVETGRAASKGFDRWIEAYDEGTVQTTNAVLIRGGASRSGMNPGAVGSNPAVDTTPIKPLHPPRTR